VAPTSADPFLGQIVVTVSDGLRVRSAPRVSDDSLKYQPLLPLGTELRVLDGPVSASGFVWYKVEAVSFVLQDGPGNGWVAIAGKDGEPWIALAQPAIAGITAITTGEGHTCALTSAGGAKCWGWNGSGQLGNGTQTSTSVPVDVSGLLGEVTTISAGGHTCALSRSGEVTCWGHNADGRLGNGTLLDSSFPVGVSGLASGVTAVEVGNTHTCALMTEGGVKCWGRNDFGQLGNGTTTVSLAPVDVMGLGSGVRAISAGGGQTCALTAEGGVKCWGSNYAGQLGNGTTTDSTVPVEVSGLTSGVVAITTGIYHTCALKSGGGVACWGALVVEQLDDGGLSSTFAITPLPVPGLASGVASISAGGFQTCAVSRDDGALCWGDNRYGQLGNGSTSLSYAPVAVAGLASGVTAISTGGSSTCALMRSGWVTCWGSNDAGALGDGSTIDSSIPVDVDFAS
jgi:alpha-tubulin suppressor-like RCC1 family protein